MVEYAAPLMFAGLIVFLLIGFPVAFSLAALGLSAAFIGVELGFFPMTFVEGMPFRIFDILSRELLLSVPFFTFMGALLERCGLAEDLLEGVGQLFGGLPGGVAIGVILVGAILGAITGTVAASVIAMGMISLPVMLRYGYDMRIATGVIAASGTITQLIPPSLVLIILADQLHTPVSDMYAGAMGPSLVQVLLFIAFIVFVALTRPDKVPPLPPEARTHRGWPLIKRVLWGMLPSVALIFLVLGTIFMGLATPTEAGAMGAVGAMVLAALHKRLTWKLVWEGMQSTMEITTMVVFILIGSTMFTLVFQGMHGNHWVESLVTSLPGGVIGFLIFVNLLIFVLAFFLDFFEIAFILIPLLTPVAQKLGIDLVWFGVLICITMQTAFMHPPFGFALFYLRGIAPKDVKSGDIYRGAIPWLGLQLLMALIVIFWPGLVTGMLDKRAVIDADKVKIELPALPYAPYAAPDEVQGGPEASVENDAEARSISKTLRAPRGY
jgi:tripartite ATP-independent transporter DctM subunit